MSPFKQDMAARVCSVTLNGSWNAGSDGDDYVDLDLRVRVMASPGAVLTVLNLGPDLITDVIRQEVFRLKHTRHADTDLDPVTDPDTDVENQQSCDRVEGERTFSPEAEEGLEEEFNVRAQETPRRLFTRGMRISPSPAKLRLFPPSPDIPEEGENSDGSLGDEEDNSRSESSDEEIRNICIDQGIFDIPEDHGRQPDMQEQATLTKGRQPRRSLPSFVHSDEKRGIDANREIENKENEIPESEDAYRRQGNRTPQREHSHKREPTAIFLSASQLGNQASEVVNQNNDTPTRIPRASLIVQKRASGTNAQTGSVSRIPIKKLNKDGSSGSDQTPVNIIVPQNNNLFPQLTHKRNSPIARMAIMAREVSNSSHPAMDIEVKAKGEDSDVESDERSSKESNLQSISEINTSTKSKAQYGYLDQSGENNAFDNENRVFLADGIAGDDLGSDYAGKPGSENFDIDELYGQENRTSRDGCASDGENEARSVDSMSLPSPSTASQRSMMWCHPEVLSDADEPSGYLLVEAKDELLTIRMTPDVRDDIFVIVANARLTLTGNLADASTNFKTRLSLEMNTDYTIPWKMKYQPLNVDGWALSISTLLPFSEEDYYGEEYQDVYDSEPIQEDEDNDIDEEENNHDVHLHVHDGEDCEAEDSSYSGDGEIYSTAPLTGGEDIEQKLSKDGNNGKSCPCCSFHIENSPLVNKTRLTALIADFLCGWSVNTSAVSQFSNFMIVPLKFRLKKTYSFGIELARALFKGKGPMASVIRCIAFALLGTLLVIAGLGLRFSYQSAHQHQCSVHSQPAIICPMPTQISSSVCCGTDIPHCLGASEEVWQTDDTTGNAVASKTTTAMAMQPSRIGEGLPNNAEKAEESGSSSSNTTAHIRARPEAEDRLLTHGWDGGDINALKNNDEGRIGTSRAKEANNDARKKSLRDRVDWALGWRGPLYE